MQITKGTELGRYFDNLFEDAVSGVKQKLHHKALEEKEKQLVAAGGDSDKGDDDDKSDTDFDQIKDDNKSKTMSDDTDALEGDVKLDDVVDKLNTIRSGKSFKDSVVQQRFEQYFNSLSEAEQVAMFAFFKGVAQIVTGEVPASAATEPGDSVPDVSMHQGPHVKTKKVKPNVIKQPEAAPSGKESVGKPTGNSEDRTPPIQAKKR